MIGMTDGLMFGQDETQQGIRGDDAHGIAPHLNVCPVATGGGGGKRGLDVDMQYLVAIELT
jgi:hypothetical protein